ncbi:helix-turn-helix domain-containing protein [Amnibacterium kyonggiense]|uniref:XRE family transcriptional regulator n=1 Tax=Amnibacterium kyonggiense TaxID=595671 RepID=A0A4R7FIY0_9MICO|nr:helix-turn-helix domain-containing protein [Amnibacterium kyonggiense]TDS75642.1 XRE family transcriptional regulator [Amnibacterium kyonggiense]
MVDIRAFELGDLGFRLKEIRQAAGLSLRELARQAGVSPSLVSQIENGKSQPSVGTLYTFARLLGVSVDELFEADEQAHERALALEEQEQPDDEWHGTGRMNPVNAWHPSEYANRVSVVHPSHRPQITMAEGVVWERLAATPEHAVNFMKVTYASGATSSAGGEMVTHEGYEYALVLKGELVVTVGQEVFHLREGESFGFDCSIPHVHRNPGPGVFEGVWFVHGSSHHPPA